MTPAGHTPLPTPEQRPASVELVRLEHDFDLADPHAEW
ncbi:MAG: hypothetical protein RL562_2878, partial [Planctomycetota bacterium]